MKLPIDKEWFEKRAAAEGDSDPTTGRRKTMTLNLTDEEMAQLQALVDERPIIPAPRGGFDPDWHAISVLNRRRFRKLEKAARKVIEEADRIHDSEPWPVKYRAPYQAITALREVLAEVGTPSPVQRVTAP